MANIIATLESGITEATLFTTVGTVMPFVITMVIFSFGYRVLKHAVKGASKGKASM